MKEKLSAISLYSIGILSSVILLFLGVKYLFPVAAPFLISWIVVSITNSPAERLAVGIKAPIRVIRLITSLLITTIAIFAIVILVWQAGAFAWQFLTDFEEDSRLSGIVSSLSSSKIPLLGDGIPQDLYLKISEAINTFMMSAIGRLAEGITSLAGALPQVFLFLLVTLISIIYFSLDYDRICSFVRSLLPENIARSAAKIKAKAISMLGKYLKSYSLLILMTYGILFVGFLILRINNAAFIALLVSVLDLLPIIGVGTVLVPWGIIEIALGNKFMGIGLIILFVLNAVIRQLAEPKIIGKSLNIHPIITLIMIYVGYSIFGIMGIIVLPVFAMLISVILKNDKTAEIG